MTLNKQWSWPFAIFCAVTIALCIVIDILQYSAVLSFLPQGLKDEGYMAHEIAAVIGSYYWAGFLGGACLTSFQISKMLSNEEKELTWGHLRKQVMNLVIGLMCGTVALTVEGLWPSMAVHFFTRFAQGFFGAFLFFFSFFLSIELFQARTFQQRLAITMSTMALHSAEVFGPFFGAAIFVHWGPQTVFFVLAGLSCVVQVLLLVVYVSLPQDGEQVSGTPAPTERSLLLPQNAAAQTRLTDTSQRWDLLKRVMRSPMLWRSILVVAPAAMVKAALENILPLFADHKLKYDEYHVGLCFTLIAVSFLCTSMLISFSWGYLTERGKNLFVTSSMGFLAFTSSTLLVAYMYGGHCNLIIDDLFDSTPDCAPFKHSVRFFYFSLWLFGMACAGCFTPAGYLLGEYVDTLQNAASKDAANGIWNTLWEVGGCMGIALSGIPNTRSWMEEQLLMATLGFIIMVCAVAFFHLSMLAANEKNEGLSLGEKTCNRKHASVDHPCSPKPPAAMPAYTN
mmetsp:Transcript_36439/g.72058  ORF Transcript_36439/g.72058 Transcript_36439/m.72058 type:complete len:509 (-) Transcript_36439:29-1555(-)|eukprot:CAMPEP_0172690750 /NCGR_PEP_ID=MMETSP1074-20121228/24078_1 /TAXON_ID=2916 /ORGANISM="Ceratium fusus, Strain PA161109" /LENGTH=508 /DNA_ID=CAMNT_0013510733 /DNA_START=39 /DNA_END=1565 /DNA_ORIENTATION=-